MKKLNLFLFGFSLMFLISCEEADKLTQFEMDYNSSITVSNGLLLDLPMNLLTPDVETNSEAEFAVNDTSKDLIDQIILTKARLEISSPSDAEFDFLKSVSVFINAEGLSELEIAVKENISDDIEDVLELDVFDNNLKEYIKKDNFQIRVQVVSDQLINSDIDINIFKTFFVDADLI